MATAHDVQQRLLARAGGSPKPQEKIHARLWRRIDEKS